MIHRRFARTVDQLAIVTIGQQQRAVVGRGWCHPNGRAIHQIDVTFNQHDLAATVARINSARGITDKQNFNAHRVHYVHW